MANPSRTIQTLLTELGKLPGVGMRSAERIVFYLMQRPAGEVLALSEAIGNLKTRMRHCERCFNLAETPVCEVCGDASRDQGQVCVVEQPKDLIAVESAGAYRGVYHVLLGRISPHEGAHSGELTIDALIARCRSGGVRELIMATNPNVEGDGTALYIQNAVSALGVKVTKLARGLPAGSSIEFANRNMLADAISGRQSM